MHKFLFPFLDGNLFLPFSSFYFGKGPLLLASLLECRFFQNATKIFQEIATQEDKEQFDKYVLNEFLKLLTNEDAI